MPKSAKPRHQHKPESLLSLIMRNRREFRARGLTAADLIVLESIARHCPLGMRRLSVAEVGRLVGLHRSTALHHVRRLEAFGAVVRLGAAMMCNARAVHAWSADAVKNRALHVKRLFSFRYSQLVGRRLPDRIKKDKTARLSAVAASGGCPAGLSPRETEAFWLVAMGLGSSVSGARCLE